MNFINENKNTIIVEWATRFGKTEIKEKSFLWLKIFICFNYRLYFVPRPFP